MVIRLDYTTSNIAIFVLFLSGFVWVCSYIKLQKSVLRMFKLGVFACSIPPVSIE